MNIEMYVAVSPKLKSKSTDSDFDHCKTGLRTQNQWLKFLSRSVCSFKRCCIKSAAKVQRTILHEKNAGSSNSEWESSPESAASECTADI